MSWQTYVDDNLVKTGNVYRAAILGLDGSVWVANNLPLQTGEGPAIAKLFANSATAFSGGVVVRGIKNLCIRADARSVYGKKVRILANRSAPRERLFFFSETHRRFAFLLPRRRVPTASSL